MFYKRISDLHPLGKPNNSDWGDLDPLELTTAGSIITTSSSTTSFDLTAIIATQNPITDWSLLWPSTPFTQLTSTFDGAPWRTTQPGSSSYETITTGMTPETSTLITSEYYNKALWFEVAISKDKDGVPTSDPTKIDQYQVKRLNAGLLFSNIDYLSATSATINILSANNISSQSITANYITSNIINTNNITATYGEISVLSSVNITSDIISSNVGVINQLHSTNIYTTNITATGIAQLTAMAAYWADLAENQESDQEYPAGTLIKFGGEKEITIATDYANAVISEKPAILMNNKVDPTKILLPIVLTGRSNVRTIGKINKFDKLYLSNQPGLAWNKNDKNLTPIGISLESNEDENEKLVEAILQLTLI